MLKPMELMVEASPRRIFANAHTYHINSISINSDQVQTDRQSTSVNVLPLTVIVVYIIEREVYIYL